MTHTHFRASGRSLSRSLAHGLLHAVLMGGALASVILFAFGCSSARMRIESPACETMRAQIKEKQALDADVKKVARVVRDARKSGDTTTAVAAERRLEGLRESQRFLKDALDNTSRDCSPTFKDAEPPLDPAVRERQRLDERR